MKEIIRASSLTKTYRNFAAVDNLNLRIPEGEIYGLLGPNGAGKTTTIKILCGLLKPTSGEANIFGKKIPDKSITSFIGYMPQETALYFSLTVHQNIEFYGELFGLKKEDIQKVEKELLKFINLEKWKDELVENLSGGMKHRVSLACALIHEPKLLFLDEPTVGVDPELRASFWNYFNVLKNRGITILITTHYMDEAKNCDRIGFMRNGHIIAEGTPKDLLRIAKTDNLEEAFLHFCRREGD